VSTVGVTSGASVPDDLVGELLAWLAERGFGDVTEVNAAEEHLLFALPQELRRDLRAGAVAGSGGPASGPVPPAG
jgi:4-hydroxy-3-methylbut-2-enyl diphosphate reductase